jgi:hypothetical protein
MMAALEYEVSSDYIAGLLMIYGNDDGVLELEGFKLLSQSLGHTQEAALTKPAPKKEPLLRARQHPASPQPAEGTTPPEAGSPLKRPPPLHIMAQRASALSPSRTHPSGGSPARGATA